MTAAPNIERVIVLLADGARADVMAEELAAGRLPNLARACAEGGTCFDAVTSFPSTTGPAYLPFLTGCFPGTCNVPGIRWFDKAGYDDGPSFDRYRSYVGLESFSMGRDLRPHLQTIFELVPGSFSIFNPIPRGATGRRNVTRISRIWHWYYAHLTERWDVTDDAAEAKLLATLDRRPRYVFTVFPGIDEFAHLSHPHHPKVLERYRAFDATVGRLVARLIERDEWDRTALFIVSDHGLSRTHTHFCLNAFLEGRGLPPFFYPLIFHKRGKRSSTMVSGNGMAHLYFKNHDGWTRHTIRDELERLSPGILDALLANEAVDLVAVRNAGGGIDVRSRRGEARVRLDGERMHYEVVGADPFGYASLPVDLDPARSLAQTIATDYPDAPFQIAHLMTSPRSGDVVVSATPGFDLRLAYEHPEHHASHGSLHASHMRVPVMTNLRFERKPIRTVDVFPTALRLLGHPIPGHIDGRALF